MYEHYEPSERIFVDRVEHLEWMEEAIKRCMDRSIVLSIRGIGGIGKSSLLEHWHDVYDGSILLDCGRITNFFDRLDALAKASVGLGIRLSRYDILWHIRQRFILGVEPAKESGREWAKEGAMSLLQNVPFIGSLASIGVAISAIGTKLSPKLTGRFGEIGEWLQTRLGKNYMEKLLEILWKDPRHAEFLYLDALLEDINSRKDATPFIIMLDHFDDVDATTAHWRYRGTNVNEAELWYVFLASLSKSIAIVASRGPPPKQIFIDTIFEQKELSGLDEQSSRVLLNRKGITEENLQSKIANISKGNPYVVNSIFDLAQVCCATAEDAEELRSDTIDEVRLKTWRRLFKEADGLLYIIDRAGLVPYFNRNILSIIAPEMKSEQWDRIQKLSFVKQIPQENWTLHELARDLVLAELSDRLPLLATEVADLLEESTDTTPDIELLSLSLSVRALASESETILKAQEISKDLSEKWSHTEVLTVLNPLKLSTEEGQAYLFLLKGKSLTGLRRIVEAEQVISDALKIFRKLANDRPKEFRDELAETLVTLADLYTNSSRPQDADKIYREAIEIWRDIAKSQSASFRLNLAITLREYSWLLHKMSRSREGEPVIDEALSIFQEISKEEPDVHTHEIARSQLIKGAIYGALCPAAESEEAYQQSLILFRKLATKEPERFENYVAAVTNNLALLYHQTGRFSEAEDAFKEVVNLRRAGAKRAPHSFRSHLGVALLNYGWLLFDIQKMDVAESVFNEAYAIFSQLAADAPDVYQNAIAGSLTGLGVLYRKTGRVREAESRLVEAIGKYREVAAKSPELYIDQLAFSLEQLGILLRNEGRVSEAEKVFSEALAIFRDAIEKHPAPFRIRECSGTLRNLSMLLRESSRFNDAEISIQDALSLLRKSHEEQPEIFARYLVATLNSYALLLVNTEKLSRAEAALQEAISIMKAILPNAHMIYKQYLSRLYGNLAVLLRMAGRIPEAEAMLNEAANATGSSSLPRVDLMEELEF
ncbi:MAG: tetratricopeptide repeat protein [Candidatus Thorarchaeota archaeon]